MKWFWITLLISLSGCKQVETPRRTDFAVEGIDVSHHQKEIDWAMIPGQGIQFAFIKATEGVTLSDPKFEFNWQQAEIHGIIRGAYHFFRPQSPVLQQVLHFIRKCKLESGDLPPVLDVEVLDGVSQDELVHKVRAFLILLEAHYKVKPVLYTNQRFYNRYLSGHFDQYHLWIARYSQQLPELHNATPWRFWQYGDNAKIEGINAAVDINVFAGAYAELLNILVPGDPVVWLPAVGCP